MSAEFSERRALQLPTNLLKETKRTENTKTKCMEGAFIFENVHHLTLKIMITITEGKSGSLRRLQSERFFFFPEIAVAFLKPTWELIMSRSDKEG